MKEEKEYKCTSKIKREMQKATAKQQEKIKNEYFQTLNQAKPVPLAKAMGFIFVAGKIKIREGGEG